MIDDDRPTKQARDEKSHARSMERAARQEPAAERGERAAKRKDRSRNDEAKRPEPREHGPRLAKRERSKEAEPGMETFRIEVGHVHGVKPANIVGAIANEAGLEGQHIGRVVIREDHSFVDLPEGMPKDIFRDLQKVRVAGQKLQISRALRAQVERLETEHRPRHRPTNKHARRKT